MVLTRRAGCQIINLNTEFFVFDTKLLVFNAKCIIVYSRRAACRRRCGRSPPCLKKNCHFSIQNHHNCHFIGRKPHQFNSIQFNSIQFNSTQFNSIQFNSIQLNSIFALTTIHLNCFLFSFRLFNIFY